MVEGTATEELAKELRTVSLITSFLSSFEFRSFEIDRDILLSMRDFRYDDDECVNTS